MSQKTILRVRELALPMAIGVLDHERASRQQVVFNIDMHVVIPDRPSEAAQDYVSYASVVEHLIALSESGRHIDLVEELADEIFAFIFADPRIERATVEVVKPEIFSQCAGVGVVIERSNAASLTRES